MLTENLVGQSSPEANHDFTLDLESPERPRMTSESTTDIVRAIQQIADRMDNMEKQISTYGG